MERAGTQLLVVLLLALLALLAGCDGIRGSAGTGEESARTSTAVEPVRGPGPRKDAAALPAAAAWPLIQNPAEELREFDPAGVLRWSAASGADVYELWVYADAGMRQVVESSGALRATDYRFTRLVGGATYFFKLYYRVSGAWAELPATELTTTSQVLKARLVNPQEELEGLATAGTLRWNAVPGADLYELWAFDDRGLGGVIEKSGAIGETQYQFRNVQPGTTVYVVVFSRVDGIWHAGGPLPVTVVEASTLPRLLNPQEELDAFAPGGILRWSAVTGASAYEAWIYTDSTLNVVVESSAGQAGRSYAPRSLAPGRSYSVFVLAKVGGEWRGSAPVRIATVAQAEKPRLTNPQEELDALATNGTLRWSEVPGATAYELWIYTSVDLLQVAEAARTGTQREHALQRLCRDGTYYTKLFAYVDGAWTSGWAVPVHVSEGESPAGCVPPAPGVTLRASAREVPWGGSVSLEWTSRFATSCAASGAWSGDKSLAGQETLGPITAPRLYTLTCSGAGGTTSMQARVDALNAPPVAAFAPSPATGFATLAVDLDGSPSTDADGRIIQYHWNLGNGTEAYMQRLTAFYPTAGTYEITLTVEDDDGATSRVTHTVNVLPSRVAAYYAVSEIPSLGGTSVTPEALNELGQVVGASTRDATETRHAFLFSDGVTRELGSLGGRGSGARDINDAGEVVGTAQNALGFDRAFLYRNGTMQDLGTLGGFSSEGTGINAAGEVVGQSTDRDGFALGFVFAGGTMRSLGTLGGDYSDAQGINDAGHVTGRSRTAANQEHAFLYRDGVMQDIGAGRSGMGLWTEGINDRDEVVGMWVPESGYSGYTGFLYRGGLMRELVPDRYTEPKQVNDAGIVVGYAHFGNAGHAFAWDELSGLVDLNERIDPALGFTLQVAEDINDRGQIVAHGYRRGGASVAVLLTPATPPLAP